ncbi:MAG: 50S ribosomal protein L11 methyltransferase [Thermoanaerobaculia bacterium]
MYHVLHIAWPDARRDLDDVVEGILFLTTSLGSQISERPGETVVSCWFASPEDRRVARGMLADVDGLTLTDEDREETDWLEVYRQSLEPLPIGERFLVAPDAALIPSDSERLPIVVPQERAFGTGSHESTALCLAMLETLDLGAKTGLDAGTGSGVLAIGMIRLGARKAFAFDNDLETWEVVPKNLVRNGVAGGQVAFFVSGVDAVRAPGRFDVITMNILPHVIIPALPAIAPLLAPEGALIVSGILVEQKDEVIAAASREKLRLTREAAKGEWWCLWNAERRT